MAKQMQEFDKVDLSFFDNAPVRIVVERRIPCSAAALFRSFEDPEAWKGWLDLDVEWTCSKPYGVGATRTIGLNGETADETFFVWDEGTRIAFRFDRSTLGMVTAFAEDYVVTPVDEKSCDFRWTVAVTPKGVLRYLSFLIGPMLKMQWGRYIDSLQKWMGEHGARYKA
ncbi:MAG: SRPBCC family protein [Deltaproteobacteria bacterium]|nr:SRPBCC family protein [Deltaproteobacteria bacterium]